MGFKVARGGKTASKSRIIEVRNEYEEAIRMIQKKYPGLLPVVLFSLISKGRG